MHYRQRDCEVIGLGRYIDADKIPYEDKENIDGYVYSSVVRKEVINSMPTEDVAPVVYANWLPCQNRCFDTTHYVCSNCRGNSFKRNKTKYCSHCGAKMKNGN